MARKTYQLTNTFHGTECVIRSAASTIDEAWNDLVVDGMSSARGRRRYLRIWHALCGQKDCKCGTWRPL